MASAESTPPDTARPPSATKTPEPPKTDATKENKDPKTPEPAAAAQQKKAEGTESRPETPKPAINLREQFKAFSKFGDTKSDGKLLTLSQSDKWMKQAKVIDGKAISTTDTAITFKKFKQMKIGYGDYEKYLQELAKYKKQDITAIKEKMRDCGTPGTRGTTSVVKGQSVVDRLTDTQKYTGSHKQRFDADGKGRGAAGRKDVSEKSGYVAGYKNKNSYDKTH